jgi:hypothetical protein
MSFRFYPTLESRSGLEKSINVIPNDEYHFFRKNEFGTKELTISGGRIKDTLWDQAHDSLVLQRDFKINDPSLLYGREGIACKNAEVGLCILWTNKETSTAGCILPKVGSERRGETGWSVFFQESFETGALKGVLELRIVLYLKKPAEIILEGEEILNNKAGVVIGELESFQLQVSDETIPFPFVLESHDSNVLWWVDFFEWEDPAEDGVFGPSSFVVTLNKKCKGCPMVTEKGINNQEMLLEIVSSVYAMLFKRLKSYQFNEIINSKTNLFSPGTISYELYRVYQDCRDKFDYYANFERIHKSVQEAIRGEALNATDLTEVSNA